MVMIHIGIPFPADDRANTTITLKRIFRHEQDSSAIGQLVLCYHDGGPAVDTDNKIRGIDQLKIDRHRFQTVGSPTRSMTPYKRSFARDEAKLRRHPFGAPKSARTCCGVIPW
jgi:hypothetical protein